VLNEAFSSHTTNLLLLWNNQANINDTKLKFTVKRILRVKSVLSQNNNIFLKTTKNIEF